MAQADWITYGTPDGAKAAEIARLRELFANIGPVGTAQRSRWEVQGDQGANVAYDGHFNENFARQLLQMGLFADRFKPGQLQQYQSGALDPSQLFSLGWYDLQQGPDGGYSFTMPEMADPERDGKKGVYTLHFNPDGTIKDVAWQNYNLSKGFLGDNLSWLGPLLVGGAAALGATAGGAAAGSAGSAGAGGGAAGSPYSLSSGMQSLGFQAPSGGSLLGGGGVGGGAGGGVGGGVGGTVGATSQYSLAPGLQSLGFKAPAGAAQMIAPEVGASVGAGGTTSLGYNLPSMGGGQGIQLGAPNLTSMGGGQGVVVPGFTQMTTPEALWPIGGGAAAPGTAGSDLLSAAGTGKTVMDLLDGAGSMLGPIAGLIAGSGALGGVRDLERQQEQMAQSINIRGPGMAPGARGMQPGGRPLIELLGRNRKANKNATDLTGGAGGGSRIGGNTLLGL